VRAIHGEAASGVFKDTYTVEFLDLPSDHSEADLHRGLVDQLRAFLIELGRDFCYVGSEFPLQVGGRDFALDLLFFHRGLNCLVAIELKVDRFEPEHLGKLNFYLERSIETFASRTRTRPSACCCAPRRTASGRVRPQPHALAGAGGAVSDPTPDRRLLAAKLHEFYELKSSTKASDEDL
jgi:hypothetical protein